MVSQLRHYRFLADPSQFIISYEYPEYDVDISNFWAEGTNDARKTKQNHANNVTMSNVAPREVPVQLYRVKKRQG
jgi:hypothetical protein